MPIREAHWYSRNEGGPYPLEQRATGADDEGQLLPLNFLVDMSLRWPLTLGQRAFVSTWFRTDALISVTFSVCDDPFSPTPQIIPVAAVTVEQPARQGFKHVVHPLLAGVGGWVVFGSGVAEDEPLTRRCSQPTQSLLSLRAARPYRLWPIPYIKNLISEETLRGVVELRGARPLEIVEEYREIDGILRRCLVFRLAADPAQEEGKIVSVFEDFIGPCGKRPESGTCDDPQPIEFLAGVPPDCDGVITLEFRGCARISRVVGECGAVVDCRLGLRNTCPLPDLPDSSGSISEEYNPIPPSDPIPGTPPSAPGGFFPAPSYGASVPYSTCFRDGFTYWDILAGSWNLVDDDSDVYRDCGYSSESVGGSWSSWVSSDGNVMESGPGAAYRLLIWKTIDSVGWPRIYRTHVMLPTLTLSGLLEAGLAANIHYRVEFPGKLFFWAAKVDWQHGKFRLVFFNGTTYVPYATANCPSLSPGKWYEVSFAAHPGPGTGQATISATLRDLDTNTYLAIIGPFATNAYGVPTGRAGLLAECTGARFSFFSAIGV